MKATMDIGGRTGLMRDVTRGASVATAFEMRMLSYITPDGRHHETEYGRQVREAEERRLAARTPAEVERDRLRKIEDDKQQLANWRRLYRAAGLKVTF